jgi:hypothetical protein
MNVFYKLIGVRSSKLDISTTSSIYIRSIPIPVDLQILAIVETDGKIAHLNVP